MYMYVCNTVYYVCLCKCLYMCMCLYMWIYLCMNICCFTFCYTGFRFFFSFNVLRNWHSRTSAHVLPLVWQHCVPWSPHKQRLCGFAYLCAHLYSRSQLELGFFVVFVVTYSIFPYLLYITDLHFCTFLNPLLILGFDTTWLSFL